MTGLRWLVVGGVALALTADPAAQVRQPAPQTPQTSPRTRPPTTRESLDRYLRGDYDGAVRGSPMLVRFDTADAQKWIVAGGAGAVPKRRLAVASFVLEYSAARPHQTPVLVPWARTVLAAGPASASEALWYRASIALCEGIDLWSLLWLPPAGGGHIAFARGRFPSDPHLQIADALGYEVLASRAGRRDRGAAPKAFAFDRIAADVRDADSVAAAARASALTNAVTILEPLTASPVVRAEAQLHLGYVRLRQGQRDAALQHFDAVNLDTSDRNLRYLGHLYAGWALSDAGRPGEAESAYRAALLNVPNGQAATVLLTSLLLANERLADAEVTADDFFAREASPYDPWQSYVLGDAPLYWTFVLRLREALQ